MPDLLDAGVWLPLSVPDHVHHWRALRYWQEEASDEMAFCRTTALALLRNLTNPRIVGPGVLNGADGWRSLKARLSQPGVRMLAEPVALDEWLERWSTPCDPRGGNWTEPISRPFAAAGECRLVAFDGDFHCYAGLAFLDLVASVEATARRSHPAPGAPLSAQPSRRAKKASASPAVLARTAARSTPGGSSQPRGKSARAPSRQGPMKT